ncbi:MAG: hypothetical protein IH948_00670 [Bacteroidetes bacterium]|nr:hypothetical protein [Bacteroidota bacterium]
MKKLISVVVAIAMVGHVFGQKLTVKEGKESIGGESNHVLTVRIFQGDEKQIMKDWKSVMKKNKGKTSNEKKELFADDVELKSVSTNSIDIWARVEPDGDAKKLIVGFNLGGAYLSSRSHPEKFNGASKMLLEFAIKTSKNAVEAEIKEADKAHDALEKEQERLVKDNEHLHKDIEKNEKTIEKAKEEIVQARKDIEQNGKDQGKKKAEIKEHQKVVDALRKKKEAIE